MNREMYTKCQSLRKLHLITPKKISFSKPDYIKPNKIKKIKPGILKMLKNQVLSDREMLFIIHVKVFGYRLVKENTLLEPCLLYSTTNYFVPVQIDRWKK